MAKNIFGRATLNFGDGVHLSFSLYKTVNGKKLYGAYSAVKRVQC